MLFQLKWSFRTNGRIPVTDELGNIRLVGCGFVSRYYSIIYLEGLRYDKQNWTELQ
jgi:hypothetical protein